MKAIHLNTIRSKTNAGELAKQRVYFLQDENMKDAICIIKNVLVESEENYIMYCEGGFAVGRKFKNKILMQQIFSIKVSSFKIVNNSFNKMIENENQRNRNR